MIKHGLIQATIIFWMIQMISAQSTFYKIHSLPGFTGSVIVKEVTPQEIHHWLNTMDNEMFKTWHPAHDEYRIVRTKKDFIGSRIYFDETIQGFRINWTWEIIESHPPDTMIFKRVGLPVYWTILLLDNDSGTEIINDMRFGIGWSWFDRLLKHGVENYYLTQKIQKAIIQHDRDEFIFLGKMINENKKKKGHHNETTKKRFTHPNYGDVCGNRTCPKEEYESSV